MHLLRCRHFAVHFIVILRCALCVESERSNSIRSSYEDVTDTLCEAAMLGSVCPSLIRQYVEYAIDADVFPPHMILKYSDTHAHTHTHTHSHTLTHTHTHTATHTSYFLCAGVYRVIYGVAVRVCVVSPLPQTSSSPHSVLRSISDSPAVHSPASHSTHTNTRTPRWLQPMTSTWKEEREGGKGRGRRRKRVSMR
jgi:hypothetical protein